MRARQQVVDPRVAHWKLPVRRNVTLFGVMLLITVAHYVSPPSLTLWHEILERLYYVPIILGAYFSGWAGGLLFAACA